MITEKFLWALQALAKPAKKQVLLFPSYTNVADELVLNWGEEVDLMDLDELSKEQRCSITKLDQYIVSISGEKFSHLWTSDALGNSLEWAKIRKLSDEVLKTFGWLNVDYPDDKFNIYSKPEQ